MAEVVFEQKPKESRQDQFCRGVSSNETLAIIRDILIPRMSRYDLHMLDNFLDMYFERLDSIRDRFFEGGPELVLSEEVRMGLQGCKTANNPKGNPLKLQGIKWLRTEVKDRFDYDMPLIEAKHYVEKYVDDVNTGVYTPYPKDQRPFWMTQYDDEPPEDLLTSQEKRWLNSEIPPWDTVAHVADRGDAAWAQIKARLGWPDAEVDALILAYVKDMQSRDPKRYEPEDAYPKVAPEDAVELGFDEFLDED